MLPKNITEAARKVGVKGEYDVLVLGGGPAGIAASIAAARSGAKTLLIERQPFLGGMATSGMVGTFCGFFTTGPAKRKIVGGVADDVLDRLRVMGGVSEKAASKINTGIATFRYHPEVLKYVAEQALITAGVEICLHTFVVDIIREAACNSLSGVIAENKSGRFAFLSRMIIDATGDGDIAFKAHVPFESGDETGKSQAMTTIFRLIHVSQGAVQKLGPSEVQERLARARDTGKYGFSRVDAIIIPALPSGMVTVNVCNIPDLNGTDGFDLTMAEIEGRRQVFEYLRAFRDVLPGFEHAEIAAIAPQVGVRETRRILGEYLLREEDVLQGAKFKDGIALGGWPVELHDPRTRKINWRFLDREDDYYAIPAGCLIPKGIENLLMAGRCISATHVANASTRVMAQALALGEAAGVLAGEAADVGTCPREVPAGRIRDLLRRYGAILEA